MEIRELDRETITPDEATEVARLWSIVHMNRLPTDPPMTVQLALNEMRPSVPTWSFRWFAMFDGETAVGLGNIDGARNAENAEIGEIGVAIDPSLRRQGLGTLLYNHLLEQAHADGRTTIWGYGAIDEPTSGFWHDHLGYTLSYDERISRCDLGEVDADLMQQWINRAGERATGYHLVRAQAPMNDDLIGHFAAALEAMNDAPLDDLEMERQTFDESRAREVEQLHLESQSDYRLVFAIETATNDLAGYTAIRVPDAEPTLAHQNDTVTVPAHRNKGIGRWLKADMWHWLREERPEVQFLDTGNAESNRAMLAINEAMGFRDVAHYGVWQATAT